MDILLNRRRAIIGSPKAPSEIQFIRGGADGSYIDTGITADSTTRIIVWARNWTPFSEPLFGTRVGAKSGEFGITATTGGSLYVDRMRVRVGDAEAFVNYAITGVYSNYHKYELNGNKFYVDDVLKATLTVTQFDSNNFNIHLFGLNSGGTHVVMNSPADISACKIYKNDVLVRDFTAVDLPSVGLYDAVSGNIFTNAGSGQLTYISIPKNAYTPLQYISSSGASMFDSGIKGGSGMDYICKFYPQLTAPWPFMFGTQTSQNEKRWGIAWGNDSIAGSRMYFLYGSNSKTWNYGRTLNAKDLIAVKINLKCSVVTMLSAYAELGAANLSAETFTTDNNIGVYSHVATSTGFQGRMSYLRLGNGRNFVAAKVNNVAGMYDTFNDVFYPSDTDTPFTAGPEL